MEFMSPAVARQARDEQQWQTQKTTKGELKVFEQFKLALVSWLSEKLLDNPPKQEEGGGKQTSRLSISLLGPMVWTTKVVP